MIIAVSNDGIQRFLDFGPDSANLTEEKIFPRKNRNLPGNTFLGLKFVDVRTTKNFLEIPSAQVLFTSYQQGTIGTQQDVLVRVGAQDNHTSG